MNYATAFHYGNFAYIYVNTSDVLDNLNDSLYRSIFIYNDSKDWVETGWGAGPNSITRSGSTPTVYAYWDNGGSEGDHIYTSLGDNTNRAFTVQNVGHIGIFQYIFDGDSSPFAYSPTMNFDTGYPHYLHMNSDSDLDVTSSSTGELC